MSTHVTPTFILKGLDPNKLLSDYQSGFFSRTPISKSEIVISENTTILAPIYGSSNYDPVFRIKDKNNSSVIIATTGDDNFQIFTRTGGSLIVGGRCDYCKQDFSEVSIGYPLGYKECTILTNDDSIPRYRILYSFWVEGELCSFECALSELRRTLSGSETIGNSERLLKMLHKFMYPNAKILRPAQDIKLLRENRGSLTKNEWIDPKHVYVRTDRILMIPAKVEYIRQNFLNPVMTIDYPKNSTVSSS